MTVSSPRLVFLLVVRLVVGVSFFVLSWRLVWRLVFFVSFRFILAYLLIVYIVVAFRLVCVSSCFSASCIVSLLGSFHFVPSCRVVFVACGGSCGRGGVGGGWRWVSLVVTWCWGGSVLFPVFRLARRRGAVAGGDAPFCSARSCPHLRAVGVEVVAGMISI